jgi:uncharacterized membrane protein YoaT (DUF817 family)
MQDGQSAALPTPATAGPLQSLDAFLLNPPRFGATGRWSAWSIEFLMFGLKQARSCLFAGLFFAAVFLVPRSGLMGMPRYDVLLLIALGIQIWMLTSKLETLDEFKAIMLFHIVGFALEVFKTSANIHAWSYPDFAYSKLFGVPLFSGFMYAAVGSYVIQAWRFLDLRIVHHPPYWMASLLALLIYVNFFSHHFIGDYRWYLAACTLGLYARTTVLFRPLAAATKTDAFATGFHPDRLLYLASRKHQYLVGHLALPQSARGLVCRSSGQMEFLVAVDHHDHHHGHSPETYQIENFHPGLASRAA